MAVLPAAGGGAVVPGARLLGLETLLASACAALALLCVYLNARYGAIAALLFLLSFAPYAMLRPGAAITALVPRRNLVLPWLLPALVLASVVWSINPQASLRHGVQMTGTVAVAILLARLVAPTRLLTVITGVLLVVAGLCLTIGQWFVDPLSGAASFVGIFQSKNQFGFLMAMLLLSGLALALSREVPPTLRIGAAMALPLCVPLLVQARSAGALVSAAVAVAAFVAVHLFARLRPYERALLVLAIVCSAVPALVFLQYIDEIYADLIGRVLNRDPTLTGRTDLWAFARGLIAEKPVVGLGWQAFWQQGNPDAEYLWRKFFIQNRAGFHFHNIWMDISVQLGLVGAVLLTSLYGIALVSLLAWNWRDRTPTSSFFVVIVLLLLARGYFEVDMPVQFQPGTVLFFMALVIGIDRWRRAPVQGGMR